MLIAISCWIFLVTGIVVGSYLKEPLNLNLPYRRKHPSTGVHVIEGEPLQTYSPSVFDEMYAEDDSPKQSRKQQYLEELRREGWSENEIEPWLS